MKSTDEIIIRHAEGSDLYAFRDLRLEALKNHPTAFGSDYTENSSKPITYWEERLKINSAEQAMFFAEQNAGLIGMATIVRGSSKKVSTQRTYMGYMSNLIGAEIISQRSLCEPV